MIFELVSSFALFVLVMYAFFTIGNEPQPKPEVQDFVPTIVPNILVAALLIYFNVSLLLYATRFALTLVLSYLYANKQARELEALRRLG